MANLRVDQILPQVIEVVERAGVLLAQEYARPHGPKGSGDKADIDVEIEEMLKPELLKILTCDWWGEETGHMLTGHEYCWVVDPNDGTSDFLSGLKGSAISVGLLLNNQLVLGVVHAPVTQAGASDCIAWAEGLDHVLKNGEPVVNDLSRRLLSEDDFVMVSAAADKKTEVNRELCAPGTFHAMTSVAYRLARVAAGDGICGISLYPVSAHGVVAGHALLRGSNGILVGADGLPIQYTTQATMARVSERVFGGAPAACNTLSKRMWTKVFD